MNTSLAITGGTIIDGRGGHPINDGAVVIEGKRIISVGDAASTPVPATAARIDAAGKYLIPGMLNASIYLYCDRPPIAAIKYEGRYDELIIEAAQLALKGGVTTVFDAWGPREYLIKAREAINEGRQVGSRIYCAGNTIGAGGPVSEDFYPEARAELFEYANELNAIWEEDVGPELMWKSASQFRTAIRRYAESGIDYIKYAVNSLHPAKPPYMLFSPRYQRIIVEEGHRVGIPIQSFSTSCEGIHQAIEAGVDILGHGDVTGPRQAMPSETVDLIAQREIPVPVLLNTDEALKFFLKKASWYGNIDRNHRALLGAGAKILLATDGGILSSNSRTNPAWGPEAPPWNSLLLEPGVGHFNWLLAAEQKGVSAMDALVAATAAIARAYKVDKDLGTIEPGKIADLVVLDKNPLEQALNYRNIADVIKEGKVVDRTALPTRRLLSVPQE